VNLKNLELEQWQALLAPFAPSTTAIRKLFAAVFAHGAPNVAALRQVPQVPARVRDHLLARAEVPSLTVLERRRAQDGFVKYLFGSPAGGRFEAVRIPLFEEKYVVCISSQVGCALGCGFCATGRLGFSRNLETWEMVDQVLRIRQEADRPVRGVVFMGMGEPLLNPTEVLRAARILSHPAGLAIAARAISLSTAGVVPAIHRYVREGHPYRLVFSLTSAIPAKRLLVMPIEATHALPSWCQPFAPTPTRAKSAPCWPTSSFPASTPGTRMPWRWRRPSEASPSSSTSSTSPTSAVATCRQARRNSPGFATTCDC